MPTMMFLKFFSWIYITIGFLSLFGGCKIYSRSYIGRPRSVWPMDYRSVLVHRPLRSYQPNSVKAVFLYKSQYPFHLANNAAKSRRPKRHPFGNLRIYEEKLRSPNIIIKDLSTYPTSYDKRSANLFSNYLSFSPKSAVLLKPTVAMKTYDFQPMIFEPTQPSMFQGCNKEQFVVNVAPEQRCQPNANPVSGNKGDLIYESSSQHNYSLNTESSKIKSNDFYAPSTSNPNAQNFQTPYPHHHGVYSFFTLDDVFIPPSPISSSYNPKTYFTGGDQLENQSVRSTLSPLTSDKGTTRSYTSYLPKFTIKATPTSNFFPTKFQNLEEPIITTSTTATTTTTSTTSTSNSQKITMNTDLFTKNIHSFLWSTTFLTSVAPTQIYSELNTTLKSYLDEMCLFCYHNASTSAVSPTTEAIESENVTIARTKLGGMSRRRSLPKLRPNIIRSDDTTVETIKSDLKLPRKNASSVTKGLRRIYNRTGKRTRSEYFPKKKVFLVSSTIASLKKRDELKPTKSKYLKKSTFSYKDHKEKFVQNQLNHTLHSTTEPILSTTTLLSTTTATASNRSNDEVQSKSASDEYNNRFKKIKMSRNSEIESRSSSEKSVDISPTNLQVKSLPVIESAIMTISNDRTSMRGRNSRYPLRVPFSKNKSLPNLSATEVPSLPIEVYFRKAKTQNI